MALLPQGLVDGDMLVPRVSAIAHPEVHIGATFDAAARKDVIEPLVAKYGIASNVRRTLSDTGLLGVLVGMACLEREGLICAEGGWKLEEEGRDETGVIFASSFAHHEGAMHEVAARARREQIARLRTRITALTEVGEEVARVVAAARVAAWRGDIGHATKRR